MTCQVLELLELACSPGAVISLHVSLYLIAWAFLVMGGDTMCRVLDNQTGNR